MSMSPQSLGLGLPDRVTCIIEDDHSHVFSNCTAAILQNVDLQGVPVPSIVRGFHQAVELCITSLEPVTIHLSQHSHDPHPPVLVDCDEAPRPSQTGHEKPSDAPVTCSGHPEKTLSEEIGWYFEDGNIPADPAKDEETLELIDRVGNLFGGLGSNGKIYGNTAELGAKIQKESQAEETGHAASGVSQIINSKVPSLKDSQISDSDSDEFDSCFTLDGKVTEGSWKSPLPQTNLLSDRVSSDDDEFESCFEDIKFVKGTDPHKVVETSKLRKPEAAGHSHSNHGNSGEADMFQEVHLHDLASSDDACQDVDDTSEGLSHSVDPPHLPDFPCSAGVQNLPAASREPDTESDGKFSLQSRLQEILNRSQPALASSVLNRSRHFRDLDSAVAEMEDRNQHPALGTMDMGEQRPIEGSHSENSKSDLDPVCPESIGTSTGLGKVGKSSAAHKGNGYDLDKLVMGLCHGHQLEMALAKQAWHRCRDTNSSQDQYSFSSFSLSALHSICIAGPSSHHTQLVDGLVVELSAPDTIVDCQQVHTALLINGDVGPEFRHRGYKQEQKVQTVLHVGQTRLDSHCARWLADVTAVLKQLKVSLLLVKGCVDVALLDCSDSLGLTVCSQLPYGALQAVAECTHANILTYITGCTKQDTANGIQLESLTDSYMYSIMTTPESCYVRLAVSGCLVQTAVLCHPSKAVCHLQEEQFWHCANRLYSSLQSGRVLLGGGATEQHCVSTLLADESFNRELRDAYYPAIYQAVARGFQQYQQFVESNVFHLEDETTHIHSDPEIRDKCHHSRANSTCRCPLDCKFSEIGGKLEGLGPVVGQDCYDDFVSKVESWRCARDVVCQLLQCDLHIVSGEVQRTEKPWRSRDTSDILAVL